MEVGGVTTRAAATWNILADQGKTLTRRIIYGTRTGGVFTPMDLTGWNARAKWKKSYSSTASVSLTSAPGGGITLGGALGTIDFTISAATTTPLVGSYVFDIELYQGTAPNEVVIAPARGTTTFRPEVTT